MFTMMTSTHVYETNEITRLGFRVGGGRDWEWECVRGEKREKERLYGFHVSVAVIFSVMRLDCLWTVLHAYEFVGWSQLDIKHPDTEVFLFFFREVRGNVTVSPLKPCIYALLMKCDGEQSWVCLHGGKSVFVHSLHVSALIHECLFSALTI